MVVGNDIVGWDRGLNRGKSSDRHFVERVFTSPEILSIENSSRPDFTLWWLWAAKEACFKAAVKTSPVVFSPRRFEVDAVHRSVSGPGGRHWVIASSEGEHWLHVWATEREEQLPSVQTRVAALGLSESHDVRQLAIALLDDLGHPHCSIEGRPPIACRYGTKLSGDLSLSHDEGFGAVAWLSQP